MLLSRYSCYRRLLDLDVFPSTDRQTDRPFSHLKIFACFCIFCFFDSKYISSVFVTVTETEICLSANDSLVNKMSETVSQSEATSSDVFFSLKPKSIQFAVKRRDRRYTGEAAATEWFRRFCQMINLHVKSITKSGFF